MSYLSWWNVVKESFLSLYLWSYRSSWYSIEEIGLAASFPSPASVSLTDLKRLRITNVLRFGHPPHTLRSTSSLLHEIILFSSIRCQGILVFSKKAMLRIGLSYGELDIGFCAVEVNIAWSLIMSLFQQTAVLCPEWYLVKWWFCGSRQLSCEAYYAQWEELVVGQRHATREGWIGALWKLKLTTPKRQADETSTQTARHHPLNRYMSSKHSVSPTEREHTKRAEAQDSTITRSQVKRNNASRNWGPYVATPHLSASHWRIVN